MKKVIAILIAIFMQPSSLAALSLRKDKACEVILDAIPHETGIFDFDQAQTQGTLSLFRAFRERWLGASTEVQLEAKPGFVVITSEDNKNDLVRQYFLRLESQAQDASKVPYGRSLHDPDEITSLVTQMYALASQNSTVEAKASKRSMVMSSLAFAAGAGLIAADHMLIGLSAFDLIAVVPIVAGLANLSRELRGLSDPISAPLLEIQKIANNPQPGEWIFIHGESGQNQVDLFAYVDFDETSRQNLPRLLTFSRFK